MNAAAFANVRLLFEAVCDEADFFIGRLKFFITIEYVFQSFDKRKFQSSQ